MDTLFILLVGCAIGYHFSQKKEAKGAVLSDSLKESIKKGIDKL
tara:strand:- start:5665 stop:5796 length:132 start_codon:yes stop_codon:yes gene_type:complete